MKSGGKVIAGNGTIAFWCFAGIWVPLFGTPERPGQPTSSQLTVPWFANRNQPPDVPAAANEFTIDTAKLAVGHERDTVLTESEGSVKAGSDGVGSDGLGAADTGGKEVGANADAVGPDPTHPTRTVLMKKMRHLGSTLRPRTQIEGVRSERAFIHVDVH